MQTQIEQRQSTMGHPAHITRADVDAIEKELNAIRDDVMNNLGERDVAHIRKMMRIATGSEVAGRTLLHVGIDPVTFVLGVLALANAKILENMEIGHNVMHGQYDWTGDPKLNGQKYDWDNVCDSDQWRHSHNVMHHTYTNIVGKDRDVGYGIMRMSEEQPWHPAYLGQPVYNAMLAAGFEWGVGMHDLEFEITGERKIDRKTFFKRLKAFLKKSGRQVFKDYVFFPAIALWNAPRVLLGNALANLIRNLWSYTVIFCGHFPEGVATYNEKDMGKETRGDWYIRQITGSANFEGSKLMHIMSGHLSHQIEHHLFPDMPAHRYVEVAPKVRAVCEKYGLPYNTGKLHKQYFGVLLKVFKLSLPAKRKLTTADAQI
ncbi:MAG TPA: acyl-CoA desaturase [Limnobacter sp.]|nr:acyl-CoA desaturase [Limnobacter sp.]